MVSRDRETLPVRRPGELGVAGDQNGVCEESDRNGVRAGDDTEETAVSVHGVVLAAGRSDRYGPENKLLQPIDGVPLVVRAVRTAVESSLSGVTVVVGYEADRVRETLEEAGLVGSRVESSTVDIRQNDAFEEGQSTSVACGVAAAQERDADAVVILLGDMPDVSVETVELLLSAYARTSYDALAAGFDGQRGNPVLFDSAYFEALRDVEGDMGGREILLEEADAVVVETGDPGVLRDVDRPSDR